MAAHHGHFVFFIDRVEIGPSLRIEGWGFHRTGGPCRFDVVCDAGVNGSGVNDGGLSGGGRAAADIRARCGLSRRDVGLAMATALADYSGFVVVAVPPSDARTVALRIDGGGERLVVPLLVRSAPLGHDWQVIGNDYVAIIDRQFLTARGAGFAAAVPPSWSRAAAGPALFGPEPSPSLPSPAPSLPSPAPALPALSAPVTVVVPIYGGKAFLYPLMRSLLETVAPPHRIVLVDDGNPDRTITAFLVALAATHPHITVIHKPRNEGYLQAVIAGFAAAGQINPQGHLVLLNSDVEVPDGWLERLVAPLDRWPHIASATPMTNAGTICSFPAMPDDNPPFLGAGVAMIDAAFAALNGVLPVEIPTGVGFCMAFNRLALQRIGFFDPAFGRGYGEEVDWCRRALQAGFVNVAVPGLYVYHRHGGSFSAQEKAGLIAASGQVLRDRYPDFDAEVQDFLRADPLRAIRNAVAVRLMERLRTPPAVVIFDHGAGGGSVTFLDQEVARHRADGRAIIRVRPALRLETGMPPAAVDIDILLPDATLSYPANDLGDLAALVGQLPVTEVVVNSLVGYERPGAVMALIGRWAEHGMAVRIYHHDYFPICPSLNLIDADDHFCGVPAVARCRVCIPANPHFRWPEGPEPAGFDLLQYRREWQGLLTLATRHVFFSRSSLAWMQGVFALDPARVRIIPHLVGHAAVTASLPPPPPVTAQPPDQMAPYRVAIVGGINVAKGSAIVAAMVERVAQHRLSLTFELFGNIDRALDSPYFHDNGAYRPEELGDHLAARGCHAVFLPSIWPETYCYVLDEVIGLGLPVGAFDIGAPAERLLRWGNGFVVAPVTAAAAVDTLMQVLGLRTAERG
jgi:GT2 family glycosyltransferase